MSQTGHIAVVKIGGSCFKSIDAMRVCAERIKALSNPVVIVSAMWGVTDQLVMLADQVAFDDDDEQAALYATGEQASAAMFAMMLKKIGRQAQSFQAWQLGLRSKGSSVEAQPETINVPLIQQSIQSGMIPVICGFQAICDDRIQLLGRGGSDTSAIFIAAQLGLSECTFYKDVPGVYAADPKIIQQEVLCDELSYAQMTEVSLRGAAILDVRAVEMARQYAIKINIKDIVSDRRGTVINDKMTQKSARVIAHADDQHLISIVSNDVASVSSWLTLLRSQSISTRLIRYSIEAGEHHWSIACQSTSQLDSQPAECTAFACESGLVAVSVVGWALRSTAAEIESMIGALAEHQVEPRAVALTDLSMTVWVAKSNLVTCVQALHDKNARTQMEHVV